MTRGTRIRIALFLVLTAVGVTYVTANYLGFVDRVLGRGLTVHATLPASGGLFEGSEVTYRGVKIGKVSRMEVAGEGVRLTLALEEGTRLPADSPMFVHNLSAVGEQYLDFEPASDQGPYVEDGDVLQGSAESLPVDEGELLVSLDDLVESVDEQNLQVAVRELGTLFQGTGEPLGRILDNTRTFVAEASASSDETIALLESGLTVLRTQREEGDNIRAFARDLNKVTRTLRTSDGDLRKTLDRTPGAARELDELLTGLEPTLPVFLSNAITANQVVVTHLDALEQILVLYPMIIANGLTTPDDGYGHVGLQFDYSVPPCTDGFLPRDQWRLTTDLTDGETFPAECNAGPPYVMRGPKHAPGQEYNPSPGASAGGSLNRAPYDPTTGQVGGLVDDSGEPVSYRDPGTLSVLGDDAWKWLLVGPVAAP